MEIDEVMFERRDIIDEDDLIYEWEEVKEKYTNTSKEEFELAQKEFQEM